MTRTFEKLVTAELAGETLLDSSRLAAIVDGVLLSEENLGWTEAQHMQLRSRVVKRYSTVNKLVCDCSFS